jgi:hypothetical protein
MRFSKDYVDFLLIISILNKSKLSIELRLNATYV